MFRFSFSFKSMVICEDFRFSSKVFLKYFFMAVILFIIPMIPCLLWTSYANDLRELNPVIKTFLSISDLKEWNFGTLEQKLSVKTWKVIFGRVLDYKIFIINLICVILLFFTNKKQYIIPILLLLLTLY